WRSEEGAIVVRTESSTYEAARLVITAGPWARENVTHLDAALKVEKKTLFWFASDDDTYSVERGCPIYLFERAGGIYYGFPKIDARGVKVAEHRPALVPETVVTDPTDIDRSIDEQEQQRVERFLAEHLPSVTHRRTDASVCMYTTTPDEHFVVDHHPDDPRVVFAVGMSGHGFKFAPVLGQALAEMALDGKTDLPVGFLGGGRLQS
ncbi:MAG: FAD-dependent oxidoreductase, partial [Pirellulales bacterium]|nr:FAD-dependent oxidoreductase [Pirellulales bacterium]